MRCPDCGDEMVKSAVQVSDMSGWHVGWLCNCEVEEQFETIDLFIHAAGSSVGEVFDAVDCLEYEEEEDVENE